MVNWLKKFKSGLIITGVMIIIITLFSLFNYLGLSYNITKYLLLLLVGGLFFIAGFIGGKKRQNKGYIAGFKVSVILIASFIILNLILFNSSFSFKRIIYYFILDRSKCQGIKRVKLHKRLHIFYFPIYRFNPLTYKELIAFPEMPATEKSVKCRQGAWMCTG